MDILRFITAGSVDDGKSTLIGRLLYDSKNILIDQLEQLEKQSKNKESGEIDLAYLTDGLRAEREQGITIDVAYRYFSTPKRKFIIADAPGHVQYTRNMITGASNANLIIILIDARQGVVEQTRRHSIIASLLNIRHVVIAINKMDLVDYSHDVFNNIMIDYAEVVKSLGLPDVHYIPVSALQGDNITVLPSGISSAIKSIESGATEVSEAFAPQSVVIQLEDDIDISRGDVIVKEDNLPKMNNELEVLLCWMDNKPLVPRNKYFLQINSRLVKSVVREIEYKLNVNTLEKEYNPHSAGLNDIVRATIKTASEVPYDSYAD